MTTLDLAPKLFSAALAAQRADNADVPLIVLAQQIAEQGYANLVPDVAHDTETRPQPPEAEWLGQVALVYGIAGCADDVARVAARVTAADPAGSGGRYAVALAYEWVGDSARSDATRARAPAALQSPTGHARIALATGRLDRAEALVAQIENDPGSLATLRLGLARARANQGNMAAARAWLDGAAETIIDPGDFHPNLDIAEVAVELGETSRARAIADAVDRATADPDEPYGRAEHVDLAQVYARLGDSAKVDRVLAGWARAGEQNSAAGIARTAAAYIRLGKVAPVRRLLRDAEAKLKASDDTGHAGLAAAYAWKRDFARAIPHALAVVESWRRVETLLRLGIRAREAPIEATPELLQVVAQLA